MSETQNTDPIRLELGVNGTYTFDSIEEVEEWLNEQRAFHADLSNGCNDHYASEAIAQVVDRIYRQVYITNAPVIKWNESLHKHFVEQIQNIFAANRLPTKDSPRGRLLASMPRESAAYALAWYLNANVSLNTKCSIGLMGIAKAILAELGIAETHESAAQALSLLYEKWASALDSAKQTESQLKAVFERELETQQTTKEHYDQQISATIEESKQRLTEIYVRANATLDDKLKNAEERLVAVEKTYDEKLALQSAVRYWDTKAKSHKRSAVTWGVISFSVAIGAALLTLLSTKQIFGEAGFDDVKLYQVSKFALIAVFCVWLMRIVVRIMLSHIHLHTDATERKTMMLTYLSLMRKGQLPEGDSRHLILQALFRPTSTGIIKDDASPPFMAEWLKRTIGKD